MERETLLSYSGIHRVRAQVHRPRTLDELRELFIRARTTGRRVSIRAAGCSVDKQALNRDMVISVEHFDRIRDIDVHRNHFTVEPAVPWGRLLRRLRRHGLIPFVVPTTSIATAGGTLSSNCFSRSSAFYGRERQHVERLTLLTPEGDVLECSRDHNPRVFRAVTGGFGFLGVVVEITYRARSLPRDRCCVETRVSKHESIDELVSALLEHSQSDTGLDAVYGILLGSGPRPRGMVYRSRFVATEPLRRCFAFRPESHLRMASEWLMESSPFSQLAWNIVFRTTRDNERYVDPLNGYTFFMDAHVRARAAASRAGRGMGFLQQCYALPLSSARSFLHEASATWSNTEVRPALTDLVVTSADDSLLSSNEQRDALLVSVAFTDVRGSRLARVRRVLEAQAASCRWHRGRILLTKNVHAAKGVLYDMYSPALEELKILKRQLDPHALLVNSFYDRLMEVA